MRFKFFALLFIVLMVCFDVNVANASCGQQVTLTSSNPCEGIDTLYVTGAAGSTQIEWITVTYNNILSTTTSGAYYTSVYGISAGSYLAVVSFSGGCSDTTNQVIINAPATPAISISSGQSDTLCSGSNLTFTASALNGGNQPVYQWLLNGVYVGSSSHTYTGNFSTSDLIWCRLVSSNVCAALPFVNSNQVRITVDNLDSFKLTPTPDCNSAPLVVHGAATATSIIWEYNGLVKDSVAAKAFYRKLRAGNGLLYQGSQFTPGDIIVDSAGGIYVSDNSDNRILYFPPNSDSTTVGKVIAGGNGGGSAANQLHAPTSICFDSKGNLYVLDIENGDRIQKFAPHSDSASNAVTVAGGNGYIGSNANEFLNPYSIRTDMYDNLYVLDVQNDRVSIFAPGTVQGNYPLRTVAINSFGADMWVTPVGEIYVSDDIDNEVWFYSLADVANGYGGVVVAGGNGEGNAANQLSYPQGLIVDASGNLYVEDERNYRIQKFPAGSTSATNGVTLTPYNFDYIQFINQGIYVDGKNDVYVADGYFNSVYEFVQGTVIDTVYQPELTGNFQAVVTSAGGCRTERLQAWVSTLSGYTPSLYRGNADTLQVYLSVPAQLIWSLNGQVLSSDTGFKIAANAIGYYSVMGVDSFGCQTHADTLYYNPAAINNISNTNNISLYPNPGNGNFVFRSQNAVGLQYCIYNVDGKAISRGLIESDTQNLSIGNAAPGAYVLMITTPEGVVPVKFQLVR